MYKLHPELQKEINRMNHAETIMKSTLEDELAYIRRLRKYRNRKKMHFKETISDMLTSAGMILLIIAWIGTMIWAAHSILNK